MLQFKITIKEIKRNMYILNIYTLPSTSLEAPCILQINNRMAAICADFSYEYIVRRLNDDIYFYLGQCHACLCRKYVE